MPPKKRRLITAYSLLVTISLSVLGHDAYTRGLFASPPATVSAPEEHAVDIPQPMTRLADSPFLNSTRAVANAGSGTGASVEGEEETIDGHVRLAPSGIYFLTVPMRAETRDGVQTLTPGTRVRLVGKLHGKLKVSRDGASFLVEEWQVTNDVDVAARLARSRSTS